MKAKMIMLVGLDLVSEDLEQTQSVPEVFSLDETDSECEGVSFCTNQQPPQGGGAVPDQVWSGSK